MPVASAAIPAAAAPAAASPAAAATVAIPLAMGAIAANRMMQNRAMNKQQEFNERNMKLQFEYAQQAEKNSAVNQVQGLKQAGLNPALLAGGSFSSGSAVGPSGGMPTTHSQYIDPIQAAQLSLLGAQRENIEADTEFKRSEIPVKVAEADLKFAQKLLVGSQTELTDAQRSKVNEEAANIRSINERYKDENEGLAEFGKTLASKWMNEPWYEALGPDTQETISAIASGSTPLSVGRMTALERAIDAQANLSDSDRKLVANAFANAITSMQFSDKKLMEAIASEPEIKQQVLLKHKDEMDASIKKMGAEFAKLLQERKNLLSEKKGQDLRNELDEMRNESFKAGDLDYLKSQGEYGKWFEAYAEKLFPQTLNMAEDVILFKGLSSHRSAPSPGSPVFSKPYGSDKMPQPFVVHEEVWHDRRGHAHHKTTRK